MKKNILSIAFVLFSVLIFGQKGMIKGRIEDNQQTGLPGANITIGADGIGTISDVDGNYYLNNLDAGTYTISISYMGYANATQEIEVTAGKIQIVDFKLEAGIDLEGVIVNSRRMGESKALNAQKNAENISTIIDAEQLERFPDNNIGDALKRIPGINVQYDQGEARFGNIRGTAPHLNSITINGERIPSAEAEIREIQLDLVPSDMVQTVEYNKAVTPDMDADAIGGSVNLVTKSAPYKQQLSGKLGSGYNFVAGKPLWKGSLTYSNRFFNDKLGMILSGSVYDNNLGSDNIEAEWKYESEDDKDGTAYMEDFQQRQYYLKRLRQSYSASFDYKFNENNMVYFKSIYNHRNDWENRYRFRHKDIEWDEDAQSYVTELRRQTKFGTKDNRYGRLEDQKVMNFTLGGEHFVGKLKVDWSGTYAKANETRPNERYVTYNSEDDVLINFDNSDMNAPKVIYADPDQVDFSDSYELKELTEEHQFTEEIDKNFKLNFELPISSGKYANKLKFGARYRGKEKQRDNEFYEYSPMDEDAFDQLIQGNLVDISKDNYMAGDYKLGHFADPKISDLINLEDESTFEKETILEELAGNFNAKEDIIAGYAMLSQNFGPKLSMIAGVRFEQTNVEYQGYEYAVDTLGDESLTQTEKETGSYNNILPSLHFKYNVAENANLRVAWTNTLARPNYYDLVPYREINSEDSEMSIGNPDLIATTSMNFDLMGEFFFKNIGIVSAGVFYKDISNVIGSQVTPDYIYKDQEYELTQQKNIGNASLFGAEFALSRRLQNLPGFLSNLTVYGNYTYVQSKLKDITIEDRENEDLSMSGTPTHTFNASLAYDTKKFDVRISYNFAGAFINEYGDEAFSDLYYDKVQYLDVNLDYKFHKNWTFYANANNLLNQPLRIYWGHTDRFTQNEYYGVKLNLGVKFKF